MRIFASIAIYVSLAVLCSGSDKPSAWILRDQAVKALNRKDYPAALDLLQQSNALARTPAERATSACELGIALHEAGRERESAQWLERSLDIRKNTPSEHPKIAPTADSLAAVYRNLGDYPASERTFREALAEAATDPESKAILLQGLADLLREEGRNAESRRLFADASQLPGISWRRRLDSTIGLADLDRDAREWETSIEEWTSAASVAREHRAVSLEAVVCRGLGQTFLERGDMARAEPLLRRAVAMFEADPDRPHQLSAALACLGQLYVNEDKAALGEEMLQRAVDLNERVLGPEHPQVAILLEMLGDASGRLHRIDRAREYMRRAQRIMAARFGENTPTVGAVLTTWAIMEQRSGKLPEAGVAYGKALAIFRVAGPDFQELRLSVIDRYVEVLKATHRKQEAKALLAEARNFRGR